MTISATISENGGAMPAPEGIRRNWVHVTAPKNKQWTTVMDGVDKLKLNEADMPAPNDGEVLVKIHAVSINYRDVEVCDGVYNHFNMQATTAIVPCSDMCGTVIDASKSNSKRFKNGARVMAIYLLSHLQGEVQEEDIASGLGLPLDGVLAQYRCFPAESLVAVPDYLSNEEASCLPLATTTAWTAMNWMRPLVAEAGAKEVRGGGGGGGGSSSKRTVLLQGTTAVALAGVQIAKAAGLRAVITGSTDEFVARAKDELGADEGINYQTHWAWEGEVMKATGDRGADIIFETGGGARTLHKCFKCVSFGGLINCIGSLSGRTDDGDDGDGGGGDDGGGGGGGKAPKLHRLNVNALALARNVTIKGVLNGGRDRLEEALAFYEKHGIKPVVDKTFKFDEAADALAYVKKDKHFGKVVITVEDEPDDKDGDDKDDGKKKKKK
ncbi:hypothetical protein PWT90_06558 [Aphanocladium album]|nr:hypothetical protein PWT90_06558 [Aphanocladium album]